jgi:hypothetical protein
MKPKGSVQQRQYFLDWLEKNEEMILREYEETPSVKFLHEKYEIGDKALRIFLKSRGVYKGIGDRSLQTYRNDKAKTSLQQKYGVSNNGQRYEHIEKLKERNSIPFVDLPFKEELASYRNRVERITKRNKKYITNTEYCYYTGIKMKEHEGCNPNDQLLKTVDHKMAIVHGFMLGIDPEIIGGVSNLVYCLRYVNSLKGNKSADEMEIISKYIRGSLINAGYEHN